jgi:uncharacterized protein (TIGR00369 family)
MGDEAVPQNPDYEKATRESLARQVLLGTIGAWLVEVKPGRVVVELPYSDRIAEAHGQFHAAVVGAIAEAAACHAALTLMPVGGSIETLEYKLNFMRPPKGLLLRAEGRVLDAGGRALATRSEVNVLGGASEGTCAALQGTVAAGSALAASGRGRRAR